MSKSLIVKDNALINASYNLELVEQRLILLAIIEARRTSQQISSNLFLTIDANLYIDEFGVHRNVAYQALKDACSRLFERRFTYQKLTEKGNIENVTTRWVQSVSYVDNEAIIRIKFSDEVTPLITNLERHFTSYELEQVSGLNSKYAIRLYELMIAWRSQGKTPMIIIDELRNKLGVGKDEYTRMGNFKTRVVDLSIKKINETTDIIATYEQHKKGRVITGFTFSFKMKNKDKNSNAKRDNTRDKNTLDMLTPIKMTNKQRSFFASKLAHDEPKCSQLPYGNESYEALARWIEKDLLKPERAEFYRPLLVKHGFKE